MAPVKNPAQAHRTAGDPALGGIIAHAPKDGNERRDDASTVVHIASERTFRHIRVLVLAWAVFHGQGRWPTVRPRRAAVGR